jgi:hypothetical protein
LTESLRSEAKCETYGVTASPLDYSSLRLASRETPPPYDRFFPSITVPEEELRQLARETPAAAG